MSTPIAPVYSPLGHSGLKVPQLWLGTMMFGDQTNEADSIGIIDATRDAGLNALDTADVYAKGESERIVGHAIASDRDRWVVATKVANQVGKAPNDRGLSRRWLLQAVGASLQRLNTDYIDLYYMHRDDETAPIEETLSTMARLIETELLPCCQHYGVGVVSYSPLARGVLTGKYKPGAEPEAGTRAARGDKRIHQTEFRPESLEISQQFTAHAQRRGMSPTQLAIAWVLNNQLVNGVIGGPRTLEQWKDYLAALSLRLEAQDESFIDALVPPGYASTHGYNDPMYPLTGRTVLA